MSEEKEQVIDTREAMADYAENPASMVEAPKSTVGEAATVPTGARGGVPAQFEEQTEPATNVATFLGLFVLDFFEPLFLHLFKPFFLFTLCNPRFFFLLLSSLAQQLFKPYCKKKAEKQNKQNQRRNHGRNAP